MPEVKTISTIVSEINNTLRSYGKEAVQEIKMTNKEGNLIGRIRYGYKPQYVFDAVNAVLLPENWKHQVLSKEIFNQQAVVEVILFVSIDNEWMCKGSHIGQMQIIKDNVGDAYKGAITDALQKCFSLLSIGTDSYRGLLEPVYKGVPQSKPSTRLSAQSASQPATPPLAPHASPQTSQPAQDNQDLPQITGVQIHRVENRFIAKGKVYDKKEMLKAAGFKWDGTNRNWFKEAASAMH